MFADVSSVVDMASSTFLVWITFRASCGHSKRLPAACEAACNLWEYEDSGDQKSWWSPETSCLPTAAAVPGATNGDFGTSPLEGAQTIRQASSHFCAWQTVRVIVHMQGAKVAA